MSRPGIDLQAQLLGALLYFFAGYTVAIKYVLPVAWALTHGELWNRYIYFWDAWWIFHIAVGYGLIHRLRGTWTAAVLLCAAEIVIIVTKFFFYLRHPNADFWHVSWFVNKSLLLVYFCFLTVWLFGRGVRIYYGKT